MEKQSLNNQSKSQLSQVFSIANVTRFFGFGALAFVFYLVSQFVQLPVGFLAYHGDKYITPFESVVSILVYALVLTGTLVVAQMLGIINVKEKLSWPKLAIFILLGEVVVYSILILGALISTVMGDTGISENQDQINTIMRIIPKLVMFVLVCLGAPILEEMVFRGFIPAMFTEKWRWIGLIIGAILFGLIHGPATLGSAVQYIGMGAILALVAYFSKRIEYSILLHFVHNSLTFLLMLLTLK